ILLGRRVLLSHARNGHRHVEKEWHVDGWHAAARLRCRCGAGHPGNKIIAERTGLRPRPERHCRGTLGFRSPGILPRRLYACCGVSMVTAQDTVTQRRKDPIMATNKAQTVKKLKGRLAGKRAVKKTDQAITARTAT